MVIFSKDSLETLRQRIDLTEVISAHVEMKRTGSAYKALCPFHDEKTPSFSIQKGDTHYHCFGCGAHGDAIQFLMTYMKMSFLDAVESLAQRFHVHLEKVEGGEKPGPNKGMLKEALEYACQYYHFMLLHTAEGHAALNYLYQRGIDLDFIKQFTIGLAPAAYGTLRKALHGKFVKDEIMLEAGLISEGKKVGRYRDFFSDRIMFPIRDATGAVIGFSGRKYKDETFGGKYVNTAETVLFKKSRVLFGLNYSRKRIAKERRVIIVEGQIDALKLIYAGLNFTVAGQGTAFGEGHVKELVNLGVNHIFLALDSDSAGLEAANKIGHLFQKVGIEVRIVQLPPGSDPDAFLRQYGPERFVKLLEASIDYLTFLVQYHGRSVNMDSPAGKNALLQELSSQIRKWDQPLMVHESLRKLAQLTKTPEEMLGVGQDHIPNLYIKKSGSIGQQTVDVDRVMESDCLRWLLLMGSTFPHFVDLVKLNLRPDHFRVEVCRTLYQTYLDNYVYQKPCDYLTLALHLDESEGQVLMTELLQKKVNRDKAEEHFMHSLQRLLDRHWMEEREVIKRQIQSSTCSDEEIVILVKKFDALKNPPQILLPVVEA
jgi:DNA primase